MSSVGLSLKREAAIAGWSLWIGSVTGSPPIVNRVPDGANLTWKPGQALLMEKYLSDAMAGGERDPNDLNVGVNLGPVLYPLLVKKTIGYLVGYTLAVAIITKLTWKK